MALKFKYKKAHIVSGSVIRAVLWLLILAAGIAGIILIFKNI